MQHTCNPAFRKGMLQIFAADALGKLGTFASLFTFKGELTYSIFKLPIGSAFLKW